MVGCRIKSGREFQTVGPATEKARRTAISVKQKPQNKLLPYFNDVNIREERFGMLKRKQ